MRLFTLLRNWLHGLQDKPRAPHDYLWFRGMGQAWINSIGTDYLDKPTMEGTRRDRRKIIRDNRKALGLIGTGRIHGRRES